MSLYPLGGILAHSRAVCYPSRVSVPHAAVCDRRPTLIKTQLITSWSISKYQNVTGYANRDLARYTLAIIIYVNSEGKSRYSRLTFYTVGEADMQFFISRSLVIDATDSSKTYLKFVKLFDSFIEVIIESVTCLIIHVTVSEM